MNMKANHSETIDIKKIYQNQFIGAAVWGYITGVRVHAPETTIKEALKSFHAMIGGDEIGISIDALQRNYGRRCEEFMQR